MAGGTSKDSERSQISSLAEILQISVQRELLRDERYSPHRRKQAGAAPGWLNLRDTPQLLATQQDRKAVLLCALKGGLGDRFRAGAAPLLILDCQPPL